MCPKISGLTRTSPIVGMGLGPSNLRFFGGGVWILRVFNFLFSWGCHFLECFSFVFLQDLDC